MQKNFKYVVNGGSTELSLSLVVWHLPCFCLSHQPWKQLLLEMCMNSKKKNPPRATMLPCFLECDQLVLTTFWPLLAPRISPIGLLLKFCECGGALSSRWESGVTRESSHLTVSSPSISVFKGPGQQSQWKKSEACKVAAHSILHKGEKTPIVLSKEWMGAVQAYEKANSTSQPIRHAVTGSSHLVLNFWENGGATGVS